MKIKQKGFTLIELMIAIAIVGFLSVTGWREYDQYQTKVVRNDAIDALLIESNVLGECAASQGNIYTGCILKSNQSENSHYNLILNSTANNYVLTATRNVNNIHDTTCISSGINYSLVINNLGQFGIRLGVGAPIFGNTLQIRKCWNK